MISTKRALFACLAVVVVVCGVLFDPLRLQGSAEGGGEGPRAEGVFSAEQVADPSRLLLSIAGRVFDVSAGEKFYGDEGPYRVFARKDASQIYGTGELGTTDFRGKDNMDDLSLDGVGSVYGYLEWYKKKYPQLGVMHGRYYDHTGQPTLKLLEFERRVVEYKAKNPQ